VTSNLVLFNENAGLETAPGRLKLQLDNAHLIAFPQIVEVDVEYAGDIFDRLPFPVVITATDQAVTHSQGIESTPDIIGMLAHHSTAWIYLAVNDTHASYLT
jgi:hypothetical protein